MLRVLDTDGEDAMLRVDPATPEDDDETRWSELPLKSIALHSRDHDTLH